MSPFVGKLAVTIKNNEPCFHAANPADIRLGNRDSAKMGHSGLTAYSRNSKLISRWQNLEKSIEDFPSTAENCVKLSERFDSRFLDGQGLHPELIYSLGVDAEWLDSRAGFRTTFCIETAEPDDGAVTEIPIAKIILRNCAK